jgi:hypothetical protein
MHSHYKTGNLGNKLSHLNGGRKVEIPEFPKSCEFPAELSSIGDTDGTSLGIPYISKLRRGKGKLESMDDLQKDNKEVLNKHQKMSREEISKEMRLALQRYLVDLIRAVVRLRPCHRVLS